MNTATKRPVLWKTRSGRVVVSGLIVSRAFRLTAAVGIIFATAAAARLLGMY